MFGEVNVPFPKLPNKVGLRYKLARVEETWRCGARSGWGEKWRERLREKGRRGAVGRRNAKKGREIKRG